MWLLFSFIHVVYWFIDIFLFCCSFMCVVLLLDLLFLLVCRSLGIFVLSFQSAVDVCLGGLVYFGVLFCVFFFGVLLNGPLLGIGFYVFETPSSKTFQNRPQYTTTSRTTSRSSCI